MSEDARRKSAPIPDEARPRKKAVKRHVRSDHRHDYEDVCIDAHMSIWSKGKMLPAYYIGKRCKICGRLGDWRNTYDLHEPPEGMRLFETESWRDLWGRYLPDDLEVRA